MKWGIGIGLAALLVVLPFQYWRASKARAMSTSAIATGPTPSAVATAARSMPVPAVRSVRVDFGAIAVSVDARDTADWVFASGDNGVRQVVLIDKRDAHVYVFDARGRLVGDTPVLLGSAPGDHTVPGVGDKPLSQVTAEERTTPAGRFIAEPGVNAGGEDVIWVDYDAAVSMHRVRPNIAAERRLERLATPTPTDNRISFGCINVPVKFYETVLSPAVKTSGAVVYVLPESTPLAQVFPVRGSSARMASTTR